MPQCLPGSRDIAGASGVRPRSGISMTLLIAEPEAIRRHALVIGTATNQPGWPNISTGVRAEIAKAERLFLEVLCYQRNTYRRIDDPGESLLKDVLAWFAGIRVTPNDWVVVYYTGHGIASAGELRLITSDIGVDQSAAATTARDFARLLADSQSQIKHALLILDTCNSGAAHLDTSDLATRLREAAGGSSRGADFHVIASARSIEEATVGQLLNALDKVLSDGLACGADDEYAAPDIVIECVNETLRRLFGSDRAVNSQHASFSGRGESALRYFPNPHWTPRLRTGMDPAQNRRVLRRIQEIALDTHWEPRARGVSTGSEQGWYFSGRSRALRDTVAWIRTHLAAAGLVIKGLPGSGKSALLARIATLAEPAMREQAAQAGALKDVLADELPPLSCIDVALHAHAKDPAQLALEIGGALSLDLSSVSADPEEALLKAIKLRKGTALLVVDALDEAIRPFDCASLLRALVESARVIVGVREGHAQRSPLIARLGAKFDAYDLDSATYRDAEGLAHYVEQRMRGWPQSPYVSEPENSPWLHKVAQAVAQKATTSFLVASATAHALVHRDRMINVLELDQLPSSAGEAFDFDMKRFGATSREQAVFVLGALAFAQGSGLPRALWPGVAQALAQERFEAQDIEHWEREAGFYIVAHEEFGQPVLRLYHEEFATHLRRKIAAAMGTPQDATAANAVVASALEQTVPVDQAIGKPAWREADAYVMAYFAKHLQRAGRVAALCELACDARWIEAKRWRFRDFTPFLDDLTLALSSARKQAQPDLAAVVRCCAVYSRFATSAPPVVLDVLAGLGQLGRARLMADNIEFALDRCHAFSLLAQRHAHLGDLGTAARCLDEASRAASAIDPKFQSMGYYWLVCAAQAAGNTEHPAVVGFQLRMALSAIWRARLEQPQSKSSKPAARNPLGLWYRMLSWFPLKKAWTQVDQQWGLPHLLFWTAMVLRKLNDANGLETVRLILQDTERQGKNLDLQAAAVAGDIDYLRKVAADPRGERTASLGWAKPGNIALALVEAGLQQEFDRLHAGGHFDVAQMADTRKRFAWALAKCGRFDEAIAAAVKIDSNAEEQARAFYRIGNTAVERNAQEPLQRVAGHAQTLLASVASTLDQLPPRHAVAETASRKGTALRAKAMKKKNSASHIAEEAWRIQSWVAPVLLAAGHKEAASALAEVVCLAGIVPSQATSLAMATPSIARAKGHLHIDKDESSVENIRTTVFQKSQSEGVDAALAYLQSQNVLPKERSIILLQLAKNGADPQRSFQLWLDALIESRKAGRGVFDVVMAEAITFLSSARREETMESLREEIAKIDRSMAT